MTGDRHVVVGTAGHVDHGKTALVLALTGTDTDRWAEEKRRGITIDLGFARLALGDHLEASVVDVPGHEDFVRNMVAGATGIDVALLVVAADEGVMPQTREHLQILRFLDIREGVIALTKTDLVDEEWLELVIDDVQTTVDEITGAEGMHWEPAVPVSARTGAGLDDVRDALTRAAVRAGPGDPDDLFRLPVDRSFSVPGAGTVVTGTTWSGTAAVGEEVRVLPGDRTARIRSIEVHDQRADQAEPGRRTALALVGLDRGDVGRGSFVVRGAGWTPSRRVDVRVTLLETARPLTQRSRIRFHLGTAEIMARVTPAGEDIPPGGSGVVRLRLDEPVVCRWGDRGVLRAYSPMTTVGGCVVIDPHPDPRPRRPSADPALGSDDEAERVIAVATGRRDTGLVVTELPVRLGVHPGRVEALVQALAGRLEHLDGHLVTPEAARRAVDHAQQAIADYHAAEPQKPGLPLEAFRAAAGGGILADHARRALERAGTIVAEAGVIRLAAHTASLAGPLGPLADRLRARLEEQGARGLAFAELGDGAPASRADFTEVAEFLVREGGVQRLGDDRYYRKDALQAVARSVIAHLEGGGDATPAGLRDRLGLSRKYLIPLLEWMDGQGITVRGAEGRTVGPHAGKWV